MLSQLCIIALVSPTKAHKVNIQSAWICPWKSRLLIFQQLEMLGRPLWLNSTVQRALVVYVSYKRALAWQEVGLAAVHTLLRPTPSHTSSTALRPRIYSSPSPPGVPLFLWLSVGQISISRHTTSVLVGLTFVGYVSHSGEEADMEK